jgi:uncharacterized protein (DUF2237 family)
MIAATAMLRTKHSAYVPQQLEDDALLFQKSALAAAVQLGLDGQPLQSCTQSDDASSTGWGGTGSCTWESADTGYHEVCVTVSQAFLQSSAENDANDLTSVVSPGGHWCICAWAFASAVQRDPDTIQGLQLDCTRTNANLRDVYQHFIDEGEALESPSGAEYEASTALAYVDSRCT